MANSLEEELLARERMNEVRMGLGPMARMRHNGGIEGESMLSAMLNGLFEPRRHNNIELPNESGVVDPRLPNVGSALMKAFQTANRYATGQGSRLERLRKAGGK